MVRSPYCSPMPGFGGGERWDSLLPLRGGLARATRPGLQHTPRDILLGLLRPRQYANSSKPDGRLPKAPRGGGRVKQSQGLVSLGNLPLTFPSRSSCLPTSMEGGFFPGIPCSHSQDKYLLSNYYVPGARKTVDTERTLRELTSQQGRRAH